MITDITSIIIPFVVALITGFFVKIVDMAEDDGLNLSKSLKYIFSVVYGILIAFIIINYSDIATLWVAVVIGIIFAGKIDAKGHFIAMGTLFTILFLSGLPKVSLIPLIIYIIAGVVEELFNTHITDKEIKDKNLKAFLELRPIMHLTLLITSIIFGTWTAWLALVMFDIGYNGTRLMLL